MPSEESVGTTSPSDEATDLRKDKIHENRIDRSRQLQVELKPLCSHNMRRSDRVTALVVALDVRWDDLWVVLCQTLAPLEGSSLVMRTSWGPGAFQRDAASASGRNLPYL